MTRLLQGRSGRFTLAILAAFVGTAPALANDSTAELGAGGLQLIRNDRVTLLSEDLYISPDQVSVAYRFVNTTDAPATVLVAFPLPPIDAMDPDHMNLVLPEPTRDNFVDFSVTVDGKAITPKINARASVFGVDRTALLRRKGLPLNPLAEGVNRRLNALPAEDLTELARAGLVLIHSGYANSAWRLDVSFYWEQTFPPGKEVLVQHRYRPVVGYSFFERSDATDDSNRTRYCIDDAFVRDVGSAVDALAGRHGNFLEGLRIRYILTTANNWAAPIKSFRLQVDKNSPDALVSLCDIGTRAFVDPVTFAYTARNFLPDRELEILIVRPYQEQ